MTREQEKEIIKSFAYGYTAAQISELEEISTEGAEEFMEAHAAEIEEKKEELKEGGFIE